MNNKSNKIVESKRWFEDHLDEYIDDLHKLVRIPSIRGPQQDGFPFGYECKKVLDIGCGILEKYGFSSRLDDSNYFLTCHINQHFEKKLGIFSHLDVVPIGDVRDWKYPPFAVSVRDNFLIGRGVGDNKGPSLLILYVLRFLQEQKIDLKYGIQIFWGGNEENGMQDIIRYLQKFPEPQISFTPDADFPVCIGEKSIIEAELQFDFKSSSLLSIKSGEVSNSVADWAEAKIKVPDLFEIEKLDAPDNIILQLNDKQILTVTAKGKSSHAAFPEGSINAVVVLAKYILNSSLCDEIGNRLMRAIIELLEDYYGSGFDIACCDEVFDALTVVGGFSESENQIYMQNLNFRTPPKVSLEEVQNKIRVACKKYGFTEKILKYSEGYYLSPNSLWIQTMIDSLEKVMGDDCDKHFYVMGGATYSRMLCNCVGFGPGNKLFQKPDDLGNGHQPDECISLQALKNGFAIYADFLLALNETEKWG